MQQGAAPPPETPAKPTIDYTKDPDTKPPFAYNLLIYDAIKECKKDKVGVPVTHTSPRSISFFLFLLFIFFE